ncbi:hypothetical protein [Hymenobacter terricola]|uniref:hypothetical protein n=1 Tax=Hymenobacter terricola TaxID=2819236 RepID=UPI001B302120|nr:hypothetical protein [Hymenobacter terricola]
MAEKPVVGYRKTYLRGNAEEVVRLMDALPLYFGTAWERDTQSEDRSLGMPFADTSYRCYHFKGSGELPAARLWLMIQQTVSEVINIVPETRRYWMPGGLSMSEYEGILDAFLGLVYQARETLTVEVQLEHTPPERNLNDVMPTETAVLFREFATDANPTTGNLYSEDAKRWYAFIISAHRHAAQIDSDFLRKWLGANTDWYEEVIERVVTETESALELLNVYDGHRRAA